MGWIQRIYIDQKLTPPRLLWIEGSPGPHEAKSYHELSHIGQLANLYQRKGKGRPLNRRLTSFLDDWELRERSMWLSQWAFDEANKGKVSTHFSPCKN